MVVRLKTGGGRSAEPLYRAILLALRGNSGFVYRHPEQLFAMVANAVRADSSLGPRGDEFLKMLFTPPLYVATP